MLFIGIGGGGGAARSSFLLEMAQSCGARFLIYRGVTRRGAWEKAARFLGRRVAVYALENAGKM